MDLFLIFFPSRRLLRAEGQEPINWDFDWLRLAFTKISRNLAASSISTGPLTLRTHYLSDNALGTCLHPDFSFHPHATGAERGIPQIEEGWPDNVGQHLSIIWTAALLALLSVLPILRLWEVNPHPPPSATGPPKREDGNYAFSKSVLLKSFPI
jgi:hypothetical protein